MPVQSRPSPVPAMATQKRRGRRLSTRHRRGVALLLALPLLVIAFKLSGAPYASELARWCSFEHLPPDTLARTHHLLFAPIGALLVVFTRLTLGIRVLGPFRSLLLAIAFQVTGALVGIGFYALVIGAVVGLRPIYRSMRLPYFGRSAAMLASVAGIIVLATLAGAALGVPGIDRAAYFPVVVLTLTGDAFATTLRKEGPRSAVWRAAATAGLAVVITGVASIGVLQDGLVRFPELLLGALAGVIIVCELLPLRLFQHLNPPPKKNRKRRPPAVPDRTLPVASCGVARVAPTESIPVP